jgi:hypothetical protein
MRGPRRVFTALAAVLVVGLVALPAFADALASKVNAARSNPLPILSVADSIAQASAQAQAKYQNLSHEYTNLGKLSGSCTAAGEVVGAGPDLGAIFDAFRRSSAHWDLITASRWTSMGTGAATDVNGTLYVSVVFCAGAGGDAAPPAETTTTTARASTKATRPRSATPPPKPPEPPTGVAARRSHALFNSQIAKLLAAPMTVCWGDEMVDAAIDPDKVPIACPDAA